MDTEQTLTLTADRLRAIELRTILAGLAGIVLGPAVSKLVFLIVVVRPIAAPSSSGSTPGEYVRRLARGWTPAASAWTQDEVQHLARRASGQFRLLRAGLVLALIEAVIALAWIASRTAAFS